ncbi:MAG: hypothetical protein JWP69_1329 [Flaviaesturariibacter sp.]|nr:hypothetical protein [Flaviaesturariibacter sp.]
MLSHHPAWSCAPPYRSIVWVAFFLVATACVSGLQTQRVRVVPVRVDSSFDSQSLAKLEQAVRLLDSVINSPAFESRVLSTSFSVGTHGLSAGAILDLIRSGKDNYTGKPADGTIDLRLAVYDRYAGGGEFGVTGMTTRITSTYRCYILQNSVRCYVSHLAHEYMHQIGFYDERTWLFGTKTHSVPYKIGNIVDDLLNNDNSCLAQHDTCPK